MRKEQLHRMPAQGGHDNVVKSDIFLLFKNYLDLFARSLGIINLRRELLLEAPIIKAPKGAFYKWCR